MTDLEYLDLAESLLRRVEASCDRLNDETDVDIDNQRTGGMITLVLPSRVQLVVNLQKPLQEVWLATPGGGHHYRWQDGQWRDTKSGSEFFADLSDAVSQSTGCAVRF